MYEQKYIKYKAKYMNLKKTLEYDKLIGGKNVWNDTLENILDVFNTTDSYGGILISQNNVITHEKYFNNTKQSQFRIFSCTKPICGLAIMILIDKKLLSIDDTIDKFNINIPNANKITIWHLLNHESGIFDCVASIYFDRNPIELFKSIYVPDENRTKVLEFDQYIDIINKNKPDFEPGTKWKYNNTAYDILGQIIYLVTKTKTTDFIKKSIFDPLDMNDSTFHTYKLTHEVFPYESEDQIGIREQYNFFGTNANIIATLRDYNKFMNDYKTLLSAPTLKIYTKLYYFNYADNDVMFHKFINNIIYPNKLNFFSHRGAGDFSHEFGNDGTHPDQLCKTLMLRFLDKNINLIIHYNYKGSINKIFDVQRTNAFNPDQLTNTEKLILHLSKS